MGPSDVIPGGSAPTGSSSGRRRPTPILLPLATRMDILRSNESMFAGPRGKAFRVARTSKSFAMGTRTCNCHSRARDMGVPRSKRTATGFILRRVPGNAIANIIAGRTAKRPITGASLLLVRSTTMRPMAAGRGNRCAVATCRNACALGTVTPSCCDGRRDVAVRNNSSLRRGVRLGPFVKCPNRVKCSSNATRGTHTFCSTNGN